jgi:hypothetical protein
LISILHSELKKNKLIANHIFLMKDLPPDHKKKILGPMPKINLFQQLKEVKLTLILPPL